MATYVLTVLTNTGSKNVQATASSVDEAVASYTPAPGERVIACELEWQKAARDRATYAKAPEEMRIRRRGI